MSESAGSTIFSSAGIQTSTDASAIMRGILLAPSGVVLTLSGNGAQGGANTPDAGNTATDGSSLIGRTGEISGSLDLSSQQFVMLLNGHKSTTSYPNVITASFDMTAPNYFAKVFNSDPLKTEESGHLLHAHYDVYPDLAAVTGSGVVTAGTYSLGSSEAKEDIALLLTSSIARGTVDPAAIVPVYESFEDRFASAETPYIISQDFGASSKDLFKVVLLSAGADSNPRYKFSIENINRVTAGSDLYGTFDLVVRDMTDTDDEKVVLESFRGLSLDPSSDRYITRVIGDQHVYYDFDTALDSQKIIVDGEYPVRSRYIRIQASTGLKNGNIPEDALPVGFRGPRHTVTSGSLLAGGVNAVYTVADAARSLREPPVPYRETVSLGVNLKKRSDARLYWGAQTTRKTSITEPNKAGLFEDSFDSFVKYLPDFRLDTNRLFRDVNAWYHIVVSFDSTQSTSTDRAKIYVNGVQETSFAIENYPSQNYDSFWNSTNQFHIGSYIGTSNFYDGLISHYHFIDGTAYDASAFGETDATTGEWKIKTSPSVTYGTNGFFILKDGNSVTDQSGNSNNFTVGGGTLTNTEDNPSNVFATMNPLATSSYATLVNGNTVAQGNNNADYGHTFSTLSTGSSGKYYWEVYIENYTGTSPFLGIGNDDNPNIGRAINNSAAVSTGGSNYVSPSFNINNSGQIYIAGSVTATYDSYTKGDWISFAVDMDNGACYLAKNGTWMNSGVPTSGASKTGAITTWTAGSISGFLAYAAVYFGAGGIGNNSEAAFNFGNGYYGSVAVSSAGTNASGNGIFEYDVPTGYTALSTKGLNL